MKKTLFILAISLISCTKENPVEPETSEATHTIQIIGIDADGTYSETKTLLIRL